MLYSSIIDSSGGGGDCGSSNGGSGMVVSGGGGGCGRCSLMVGVVMKATAGVVNNNYHQLPVLPRHHKS